MAKEWSQVSPLGYIWGVEAEIKGEYRECVYFLTVKNPLFGCIYGPESKFFIKRSLLFPIPKKRPEPEPLLTAPCIVAKNRPEKALIGSLALFGLNKNGKEIEVDLVL